MSSLTCMTMTFIISISSMKETNAITSIDRNGMDMNELISFDHCYAIIASKSMSLGKEIWIWKIWLFVSNVTFFLDFDVGFTRFSNAQQLLSAHDERLSGIIASTSCLATIVDIDSNDELSQLIDFVNNLHVKEKKLVAKLSFGLDTNMMQNRTINYDVAINHLSIGTVYTPLSYRGQNRFIFIL